MTAFLNKYTFRLIHLCVLLILLVLPTGCFSHSVASPTGSLNINAPGLGSFYSESFIILEAPKIEWVGLEDMKVDGDLKKLLELEGKRSADDLVTINHWDTSPTVAWNEVARNWVAYYGLDPVVASRVYAIISVSQYRSLRALASIEVDRAARRPNLLATDLHPIEVEADPYESSVLLGATRPVLLYLFPDSVNEITTQAEEVRQAILLSGNILPLDLQMAERFGEEIADQVIAERRDDGSAEAGKPVELPVGVGIWTPDPFRAKPEKPGWMKVKPWLLENPDQFRPGPPAEFGTPAFDAAVAEVREAVASNSPADLEIVRKWADKRGTFTPPGHWNLIASDLISKYGLSDWKATSIFTAMNMALMDAGIACWDAKYHYLVVRPWQADPTIAALAGYPNHPSYPSGHSCFSWTAATILSYYFPEKKTELFALAEEASISRLKGGLHYRMDLVAGRQIGEKVGGLAIDWSVRAEK